MSNAKIRTKNTLNCSIIMQFPYCHKRTVLEYNLKNLSSADSLEIRRIYNSSHYCINTIKEKITKNNYASKNFLKGKCIFGNL